MPTEPTKELDLERHDSWWANGLIWQAAKQLLADGRCDWCHWPLAESVNDGCIADNCSMRPLPKLNESIKLRRAARLILALGQERDALIQQRDRAQEASTHIKQRFDLMFDKQIEQRERAESAERELAQERAEVERRTIHGKAMVEQLFEQGAKIDSLESELAQVREQLLAAESRPCVEICEKNRAEGRGPCGACALCCNELKAESDDLQQTFDLRWKADMRAIKRWQEAHPGNDLVWPDHADLCVWLLEELAKVKAERDDVLGKLREYYVGGDESAGEGVHVVHRGRYYGQGPVLWAVKRRGDCLSKSGKLEWEPQPSSRTEAFIKRCRWESFDEALAAAKALLAKDRKGEMNG